MLLKLMVKIRELAVNLDEKGYKNLQKPLRDSDSTYGITKSFPRTLEKDPNYKRTGGINKELKRRSRVSRAYSNDQLLLKVAVCIMIDISEDWITGKSYFILGGLSRIWTQGH